MASIREEFTIDTSPDTVWAALRDFGAVHERLARDFVVAADTDGDTRVVTFANGAVAREVLVAVDDDERRLVYTVGDSPLGTTHHNASAQVFPDGAGSRFVWTTDVLPHAAAPRIREMMALGAAAIRHTLDSPTPTPTTTEPATATTAASPTVVAGARAGESDQEKL